MSAKTGSADKITAFKAFDKNMQCRGYQFEVGKTFEHDGPVEACKSVFHACEYALDVFNYYAPSDSRFAIVHAQGEIKRHEEDSKIACAKLTIDAEIKIPDLVSNAVAWILSNVKRDNKKTEHNTGHYSAATNTGDYSAATNTGHYSAATNTGDYSAATNTGNRSAATNTGHYSAATNTGNRSAATNTGNRSAATNTGNRSAATNTGDYSAADVSGKSSVAIATGHESKAKASAGSAIVLCSYNEEGELAHIRSAIAGQEIKADTWYTLGKDGEFIEVDSDEKAE